MKLTTFAIWAFPVFALAMTIKPSPQPTGEKLYKSNCAGCHPLFEKATGQPMYGALERATDKKWLYQYIQNFSVLIRQKDPLAVCLKEKSPTVMPVYIKMTEKEIDAIYEYVYAEAKKNKEVWMNKKFFKRCQ